MSDFSTTDPTIQNNLTAPDASILSGGSATLTPGSAAPTLSGFGGNDSPAAGAPNSPVPGVSGATISPDQITPTARPAGTPSVWKNILMGALQGLAGSAGSTSFGGGLAKGAAGVEAARQREIENQQAATQLQFESLKAAHSVAIATQQAQEISLQNQETAQALQDHAESLDAMRRAFGLPEPNATVSENHDTLGMHSQAAGVLQNLATQNPSGKVGEVVIAQKPVDGHQIDVYSAPTPASLQQTPNSYLKLVNSARAVNGQPALSQQEWNTGQGTIQPNFSDPNKSISAQSAWQSGQVQAAQKTLYSIPTPTGIISKDSAIAASLDQQLASYKKSLNPDPNVVTLLTNRNAAFSAAISDAQDRVNKANAAAIRSNQAAKGNDTGNDSALVDQIGLGKMPLERLDYLATRNPKLLDDVSAKYPDFDGSKIKSYVKTYQDFTSGKTSVALNSGATALKHLAELRGLNTDTSRIPGTSDYNAYQNKLNTVVGELIKFYGMPDTNQSVDAMKKGMGAMFNRDSAIVEQAKSMGDKLASYQQTWENAAPSKSYQAPLPAIDNDAKTALASLDPDFISQHPAFAPAKSAPFNPSDVVRTGTLRGAKVYQLKNGSVVDATGKQVVQ